MKTDTAGLEDIRVSELPLRRFAVRPHIGPESTVEETRRPLYQHLIMHELVGGPPVLRFLPEPDGDHIVDVLVGTTEGFQGDEEVPVERMPAGWYAIGDYEGPADRLPTARAQLIDWCRRQGHEPKGAVLQVHLMDEIEGATEQQLQVPIA